MRTHVGSVFASSASVSSFEPCLVDLDYFTDVLNPRWLLYSFFPPFLRGSLNCERSICWGHLI